MTNGFPQKEPDADFSRQAEDDLATLLPVRCKMHTGQLEDVLTALETGRDVAITGEDGRRTIGLITAVYKAGSAHMPVTLPIQPEDPFYTVAGIRASVPHVYKKSASVAELTGDITFGSDFKKS